MGAVINPKDGVKELADSLAYCILAYYDKHKKDKRLNSKLSHGATADASIDLFYESTFTEQKKHLGSLIKSIHDDYRGNDNCRNSRIGFFYCFKKLFEKLNHWLDTSRDIDECKDLIENFADILIAVIKAYQGTTQTVRIDGESYDLIQTHALMSSRFYPVQGEFGTILQENFLSKLIPGQYSRDPSGQEELLQRSLIALLTEIFKKSAKKPAVVESGLSDTEEDADDGSEEVAEREVVVAREPTLGVPGPKLFDMKAGNPKEADAQPSVASKLWSYMPSIPSLW